MGKKTPLYKKHLELKGKIVDFAGFELPVEFSGIIKEHLNVRSSLGIFDVSHMGEIEIKGKNAIEFLQKYFSSARFRCAIHYYVLSKWRHSG